MFYILFQKTEKSHLAGPDQEASFPSDAEEGSAALLITPLPPPRLPEGRQGSVGAVSPPPDL